MANSPIADLSYRNYDGPLDAPTYRWQVIARAGIRQAFASKLYWGATLMASWFYFVLIIILYFVDQFGGTNPQNPFSLGNVNWQDRFLDGFGYAQLILMIVTLLVGAGAIANDNRSRALLVYLSKPCTRGDYLMGKWFGIFIPLCVVMLIPATFFFLYGAMSYREHGFLSANPWTFPKMFLIIPCGAALHTSLILGVSSMFNQGRVAGAVYAGIYFVSNFFTRLMAFAWISSRGEAGGMVKTLFYGSIDGVQIGIAKAILGTSGSAPFGGGPMRRAIEPIPAPPLVPFLLLVVLVSAVSLWVAWSRIRAVEVVG